jgi:hypothetical protein
MMKFRSSFLLAAFLLLAIPAHAQDSDVNARLELARRMHDIRPTETQVNAAIDQAAAQQPEESREAFRTAMRKVLNYKAIEQTSIDAMAKVYTTEELKAMVEYYSKPEARSAGEKEQEYAKIVYPEIIRLLDQAVMRVKTGG